MSYIDINGRRGITALQGNEKWYGDTRLMDADEITDMLADGIIEASGGAGGSSPLTWGQKVKSKKMELQDCYAYVVRSPVSVDVQGQTKEFPMTDQDREWMNGMNTALGAGWTPGASFYRKDKDGNRVSMNMSDIRAMGKAAMEVVESNTVVLDDLMDQVDAVAEDDDAALAAIVWPWPGGIDPRIAG